MPHPCDIHLGSAKGPLARRVSVWHAMLPSVQPSAAHGMCPMLVAQNFVELVRKSCQNVVNEAFSDETCYEAKVGDG